jgi:hypothetical protein
MHRVHIRETRNGNEQQGEGQVKETVLTCDACGTRHSLGDEGLDTPPGWIELALSTRRPDPDDDGYAHRAYADVLACNPACAATALAGALEKMAFRHHRRRRG